MYTQTMCACVCALSFSCPPFYLRWTVPPQSLRTYARTRTHAGVNICVRRRRRVRAESIWPSLPASTWPSSPLPVFRCRLYLPCSSSPRVVPPPLSPAFFEFLHFASPLFISASPCTRRADVCVCLTLDSCCLCARAGRARGRGRGEGEVTGAGGGSIFVQADVATPLPGTLTPFPRTRLNQFRPSLPAPCDYSSFPLRFCVPSVRSVTTPPLPPPSTGKPPWQPVRTLARLSSRVVFARVGCDRLGDVRV